MGNCGGKDPEKTAKDKAKKTIKVAILGTAASGKSTFFKQMQILNCDGFDETENQNYLRILRSNFYTGLKELVSSVETLGLQISNENEKHAKFFKDVTNVEGPISGEVIQQAQELWNDEAIRHAWEKRDSLPNFTIINFDYILKNIDRLSQQDAIATNDDIVRCRQRTTGLSEIEFPFGKHYFHLFDVGGQKPERRKWDVIANTHKPTSVLFFTSLVDYDIPLLSEEGKTRMDESLEVWEEILNKEEFENTTIILFLNKADLFEDKVERVSLSETFKDYKGKDYQAALDFIKQYYLNKSQNTKHKTESIHVHTTCAIDTNVMQVVFESVTEEIFKQRLALAGLDL